MAVEDISKDLLYLFLEEDIDNKELFFDADTPPAITKDPKKVYQKKEKQHELQLLRLTSKHAFEWSRFNEEFTEKNDKRLEPATCLNDTIEGTLFMELVLSDIKETMSCATATRENVDTSKIPSAQSSIDDDPTPGSTGSNVKEGTTSTNVITGPLADIKTADENIKKKKKKKIVLDEEEKKSVRKYRDEFIQLLEKQQAEVKVMLQLQMAELKELPEEYQRRMMKSLPPHLRQLLESETHEYTAITSLKRPNQEDTDSKEEENRRKIPRLAMSTEKNLRNETADGRKDDAATKHSDAPSMKAEGPNTVDNVSDSKPPTLKKKRHKKKKSRQVRTPLTYPHFKSDTMKNNYKPLTPSPLVKSTFTRIETPTSSSSSSSATSETHSQQPLFFNISLNASTQSKQKKNKSRNAPLLGPNSTLLIKKKPKRTVIVRHGDCTEHDCGDPADYNDAIIGVQRSDNPVSQRLMNGEKYLFYRNAEGKLLIVGTTAQIQPYIKKFFLAQ